jgi:hypothetical protein
MKYWLVVLTAALSLVAMDPGRATQSSPPAQISQ